MLNQLKQPSAQLCIPMFRLQLLRSSCSWLTRAFATQSPSQAVRPHFDFKFIRDHAETVQQNIIHRKVRASAHKVAELYAKYTAEKQQLLKLHQYRNEVARDGSRFSEGKAIKEQIAKLEPMIASLYSELEQEACRIPNSTHPDAPVGGEHKAKLLRLVGAPKTFQFPVRDHVQIGQELDLFDWEGGAAIAGSQFAVLKNEAALLELALVNWSLHKLVSKGFTPVLLPDLVHSYLSEGCGFQPRNPVATNQNYRINDSLLCLAATAEIPSAGLLVNKLLPSPHHLPLKLVAFGHAFRTEAGAKGVATRGLYRIHQFSKVEMFVFCSPEDSDRLHQELVDLQVEMFSELGLHFRVLDMPTEDLGAAAYRKIDIEAWMPGRGSFGEVSSASNCTDYQSRRLNIRVKDPAMKENIFVHTLNGTACAVPRLIISLLEQNQTADGSISLPACLQPFLGFSTLSKSTCLANRTKPKPIASD